MWVTVPPGMRGGGLALIFNPARGGGPLPPGPPPPPPLPAQASLGGGGGIVHSGGDCLSRLVLVAGLIVRHGWLFVCRALHMVRHHVLVPQRYSVYSNTKPKRSGRNPSALWH